MQCGAAARGSLATRTPGWRSSATILGATAILAIAAASAAYAALNKKEGVHPATATFVRTPGAAGTTATTPGTAQAPPVTAKTPSTPPAAKPALPKAAKPPKIPLTAATPPPAPTSTPTTSTPTASTPTASTPASPLPSAPAPTAIVLDTNAVSTYNPDNYPAGDFGEPSLTIDGETSTAWTAPVYPDIAPKMAVGLLVDLKAPQKLSSLELVSSTPGMTVQVFAANGSAAPTTIGDPAWVKLTKPTVEENRHEQVKLGDSTKGFRFVLLWISAAPASAVGTPQAPGHVTVNEIELFPAK